MKKMKTIFIAICVLVLIILIIIFVTIFIGAQKYSEKSLFTDTGDVYLDRAKEITGLDLDHGKVIKLFDTKGGFLGEAKVLLELQYSNEDYKAIEEQISAQKYWKKLPLEDDLTEHLLGLDFELPQNGYYLFYDRHSEADFQYDYKKMKKRHSMDFSVLILDNDAKKIIYIEKDT